MTINITRFKLMEILDYIIGTIEELNMPLRHQLALEYDRLLGKSYWYHADVVFGTVLSDYVVEEKPKWYQLGFNKHTFTLGNIGIYLYDTNPALFRTKYDDDLKYAQKMLSVLNLNPVQSEFELDLAEAEFIAKWENKCNED
jgi:hypothetical protein